VRLVRGVGDLADPARVILDLPEEIHTDYSSQCHGDGIDAPMDVKPLTA
jgi:hypothetical protein